MKLKNYALAVAGLVFITCGIAGFVSHNHETKYRIASDGTAYRIEQNFRSAGWASLYGRYDTLAKARTAKIIREYDEALAEFQENFYKKQREEETWQDVSKMPPPPVPCPSASPNTGFIDLYPDSGNFQFATPTPTPVPIITFDTSSKSIPISPTSPLNLYMPPTK